MKNIKDVSDDELQAELNRREYKKRESEKPKQLEIIDTAQLRYICQEYIDEISVKPYSDSDLEHYIFERAVEMIFGNDVWTWINKQSE